MALTESNTRPADIPSNYLRLLGLARLQYTNEYLAVIAYHNRAGKERHVVLSPVDARDADIIVKIMISLDAYYPDVPSLIHQAERVATATSTRRGLIAISNGWLDDQTYVFGDRVIKPSRATAVEEHDILLAAPHFDSKGSYNLAGRGSAPPEVARLKGIKGSVRAWKDAVGDNALYSSCAMVVLAAAFAAPLLRLMKVDGLIILITDPTSAGKTTLERIAASVGGYAQRKLPSWKITESRLEADLHTYCDMLYPIDDLKNAGSADNVFAMIDAAAYFVDGGGVKGKNERMVTATMRQPLRSDGVRTILLTSYERHLAELERIVGKNFDGGVRMRVLEIPSGLHGRGVFDRPLPEVQSAADLVKSGDKWIAEMREACAAYHGKVFTRWLQKIIDDPARAAGYVQEKADQFIETVTFDRTSSAALRHVKLFAFLYGCGSYAIIRNLLPWSDVEFRDIMIEYYYAARAQLQEQKDVRAETFSRLATLLSGANITDWNDRSKDPETMMGWSETRAGHLIYRVRAEYLAAEFPGKTLRILIDILKARGILRLSGRGTNTDQIRLSSTQKIQAYILDWPADPSIAPAL